MKRKYWLSLLFLLALGLPVISIAPPSSAIANLYIIDARTHSPVATAEPGNTFSVEVRISGAVDVFGYEFLVSWNASVLDFTSIEEGDFLKGIEDTETRFTYKVWEDEVGNDTVGGLNTRLGYISGADGSGIIATITFVAAVKGETPLYLHESILIDSRPTPYPIEHTTTDGLFTNIAGFPIASFTVSPPIANIGQTITFDASASNDPDGSIVAYFWDFGDGQNAGPLTDPYMTHAYSEGGLHYVTLNVTDNENWNGTLTKEVKIRFPHDVAIVSVSTSQQNLTVGETLTITVIAMNDGASTESFAVKAYCGDIETGPEEPVSNLAPGLNKTLTFEWNTEGVEPGDYRIKATADPVPDEEDLTDNTKLGSTITVLAATELPWLLYGGIAGGVAIAAVIVVIFLRRRGAS